MKWFIKLIFELLFDFLAVMAFLLTIVSFIYAIMFARRHLYEDMRIALVVMVAAILIGVGFTFVSSRGNKKRFNQKFIDNFWTNILPPW